MATPAVTPDATQQPTPPPAAAPPAPAPQPDASLGTTAQTIQPQAQQTIVPQKVLIPEKRGGLGGIVDEFRNAVAGTTGRSVYIDPDTGERYVQNPQMTGKQQWMKLGQEALRGAASGLAVGRGAGNQFKGLQAGVQSQQQAQQQQTQEQDTAAEQDYERQKQAKLAKANSQLLTTQIAANEFALKRQQVAAGEDDIKFANAQEDREKELGSSDLGVYPDHVKLADVKAVRPQFWKDHYQNDAIVAVPAFDQDGNRQGVHLYLRQPGIGDTPAAKDAQAFRFVQGSDPKKPPTLEPFTPSGVHTQRDIDTYNNAAFKQMQDWQTAQASSAATAAKTAEAKSETTKNYAEAGKANTEAQQTKQAVDSGNIDDIAQMLVDGRTAPSQLPKRMSKGSNAYDQIIERADQLAKAQGQPTGYDAEQSESDYKSGQALAKDLSSGQLGNNIQSFNKFAGHLADLGTTVDGLRNSNSPLLNRPVNWLKQNAQGNPQVSDYLAARLPAVNEFVTFLQNNHALSAQDEKDRDQLLNENLSPAQQQVVMKRMAQSAAIQMGAIQERIKNTPGYRGNIQVVSPETQRILSQFGATIPGSGTAPRSGAAAPQGATNEVHQGGPTGPLIGHIVNGKYVALTQ